MKNIYTALEKRLSEIPALRWIDFDTGQIEAATLRPAVDFPAVLIDLGFQQCEKHGLGVEQFCRVNIDIKLVYWTEAHSFNGINETMKQDALGMFDLIDQIQDKLHEWQGTSEFVFNSPLYRQSVVPVQSAAGLKVYHINYQTTHIDRHEHHRQYQEQPINFRINRP